MPPAQIVLLHIIETHDDLRDELFKWTNLPYSQAKEGPLFACGFLPFIVLAPGSDAQADLAERLEVSRQSVNAIETGKYDPSLPLAFKLARLFETTIEAIFSDEK